MSIRIIELLSRPGWRGLRLIFLFVLLILAGSAWWEWPAKPRLRWGTLEPADYFAVSPDGRFLASAHSNRVSLWDTITGKEHHSLVVPRLKRPKISGISFSPDSQLVQLERWPERQLWDPTSNRNTDNIGRFGDFVLFRTDGKRAFVIELKPNSMESTAFILDAATREKLWSINLHARRVFDTVSTDKEWLAGIQNPDRSMSVLDLNRMAERIKLPPPTPNKELDPEPDENSRAAGTVVLSRNGQLIVRVAGEEIEVWDLTLGRKRAAFRKPAKEIELGAIGVTDVQSCLIIRETSAYGPLLTLWDISSASPRLMASFVGSVSFSSDDRWILAKQTIHGDYQCMLYDAYTYQKCWIRELRAPQFSPDAQLLIGLAPEKSGLTDRWLQNGSEEKREQAVLLEVASGRELTVFSDVTHWDFFPDSKSLVLSRADNFLEIWDIPPRRQVLVDYGLPVLFGLMLLLLVRSCFQMRQTVSKPNLGEVEQVDRIDDSHAPEIGGVGEKRRE